MQNGAGAPMVVQIPSPAEVRPQNVNMGVAFSNSSQIS